MWEISPLDFELNQVEKPVFLHSCPIPKVQTLMFKEEVECLVELGVLEQE